jgi:hypothetical protein
MADEEIKVVITASDKASNVILGISRSLSKITSTVTNLTKEYADYGDEVKKLSQFTGLSTDETSRMIQMADDAFVSFDTLRMSAKYMADNGIAPNIENMAQLSDKFLSIQDPLLKSQFLIDNFSRSGVEMGNIMALSGDKIRSMVAAVEKGLIITPEKLASIQEGKKALDQFNDSLDAMRYDIAGNLLGIFKDMPKPIQDTTLAIGMLTDAGLIDGLANMSIILNNVGGLGPKLTGVGTALKGVAVGAWAAVGPVLAVAAAIASAGYAIKMLFEFISNLIGMLQKAAANGKLWEFMKALNIVNIVRNIDIGASANMLGIKLPGKASGGSVMAGHAYMVGERGPEPFIPSVPGTILPNGTGFGSGMNFQFVYAPIFSPGNQSEVENVIRPAVLNILRGRA